MRVLTTTLCYPTPDQPDQGIFVQRRAEALAKHSGVEVTVVSPQPWCPLLRRYQPVENAQHPLPAYYPKMLSVPVVGWLTDGLAFARSIERFIAAQSASQNPDLTPAGRRCHTGYGTHSRKARSDSRIDLIDAHFEYPDGVGAWLVGRKLGIPVVVTVRGKIVRMSRRAIRRTQIRAMLRGTDARIAVSESLAARVRDVGGSDLSVDVIPNGVDVATYHLVARETARSALGWDPRPRYILAVGHMQKLKGFDRIVGIMPAVRSALGDVRLVLAGSQRGERSFRRKVRGLIDRANAGARMDCGYPSGYAHGPCVQFAGPVPSDELNLMYNAADVFVNASRSEGWCNAIAESLAAGTPVVATNVGGNREQICASELGTIVPDGDVNALARAVVAALSRDWNRLLISAHGSARRWTHVANEVHAVFTRVLAARAAARRARQPFFPLAEPDAMLGPPRRVAPISEVSR